MAVPLLTLPTLSRTRETHAAEAAQRADARPAGCGYLCAAARPAVRGQLAAQILWVLGYAALSALFLLDAERELGLAPSLASLLLAAFGIMTAAAIVAAGRAQPGPAQASGRGAVVLRGRRGDVLRRGRSRRACSEFCSVYPVDDRD